MRGFIAWWAMVAWGGAFRSHDLGVVAGPDLSRIVGREKRCRKGMVWGWYLVGNGVREKRCVRHFWAGGKRGRDRT